MRARSLLTFPTDVVAIVFLLVLLPFAVIIMFFRFLRATAYGMIQEEEETATVVEYQQQEQQPQHEEAYATTTTTRQPRRYFTRAQARRITVVS